MEKKITTVWIRKTSSNKQGKPVYTNFSEIQAYLYSPEEHASVQGYREAFEKIEHYATNLPNKETACIQIKHIVKSALSKAEDKGDNGWISVEDRLPEIGSYVIAYDGNEQKVVKMTTYLEGSIGYKLGIRDCWFEFISHNNYVFRFTNVTHWQPLPPKP